MGSPEYADLVVSQSVAASERVRKHYFSEIVGYGLWALFHIFTVIVLLNMLIAMMSDSFQRIQVSLIACHHHSCSSPVIRLVVVTCVQKPQDKIYCHRYCRSSLSAIFFPRKTLTRNGCLQEPLNGFSTSITTLPFPHLLICCRRPTV